MQRIRLGVICGGRSLEHQVSLLSVQSVLQAIDPQKYQLLLFAITPKGEWRYYPDVTTDPHSFTKFLLARHDAKKIALQEVNYQKVFCVAQHPAGQWAIVDTTGQISQYLWTDVVFPVMHGNFAEDGKLQGLLEMLDVAYVGPDVLSSAICMDKAITKALLLQAKIPVVPFLELTELSKKSVRFSEVSQRFGLPLFVKPANAGSSVGVNKVTSEVEWSAALAQAFAYDRKVLVEQAIMGRELECAVLGNSEAIEVGAVGEIQAAEKHGFYSYSAKYLDEEGAKLMIPAPISPDVKQRVQQLARQTYQVLQVEGMARVDFFLQKDGQILVNEVNTIPGFTKISMYPKLMMQTGLTYAALIDELLIAAQQRHQRQHHLLLNQATLD